MPTNQVPEVGKHEVAPSGAWNEEARIRVFALQVLTLLRVHVAEAAPPEVWAAVEALESALRRERWPELGEDWKAVGLTRAWEDVTRAVRSAGGLKLRRYEVKEAVSAAMEAVGNARRADHARDAAQPYDVRSHLREVSACMEKACKIAADMGVPQPFFEPLLALLPDMPARPERGR